MTTATLMLDDLKFKVRTENGDRVTEDRDLALFLKTARLADIVFALTGLAKLIEARGDELDGYERVGAA